MEVDENGSGRNRSCCCFQTSCFHERWMIFALNNFLWLLCEMDQVLYWNSLLCAYCGVLLRFVGSFKVTLIPSSSSSSQPSESNLASQLTKSILILFSELIWSQTDMWNQEIKPYVTISSDISITHLHHMVCLVPHTQTHLHSHWQKCDIPWYFILFILFCAYLLVLFSWHLVQ